MKRRSKRSAASDIGSRRDAFWWARLKLSFFYLAMIAVVVLVLGSAVYSLQVANFARYDQELEEQGDEDSAVLAAAEKSLSKHIADLREAVLLGGLITVGITGFLGYFLAGRTLKPIRIAHEMQQRFFANAAHDLRTPLAVMKSDAEVALRGSSPNVDDLRRLTESQVEEIDRMSAMVDEMLLLGRADHGSIRAPETESEVDVARIAERVVRKMASAASEKRIDVETDLTSSAVLVAADALFERMISNLVQNAIAYTPAGGSIVVAVDSDGPDTVLTVSDTGAGISETDLAHVTEPFYRGDTARGSDGSGLGLAIVREIVTAYGGDMQIRSRPGAGTSVVIRIPGPESRHRLHPRLSEL